MPGGVVKFILCITGMPGAGKSTVASVAERSGFSRFVLGDIIRTETARRGLEPTDENCAKVMLELRRDRGPGVIAELCAPRVVASRSPWIVIDGVRSPAEVRVFKKLGKVVLVAVRASPTTRFRFLKARGRKDDPASIDELVARDNRELKVGIGEALAEADKVIVNDGRPLPALRRSAKSLVQTLTRKN